MHRIGVVIALVLALPAIAACDPLYEFAVLNQTDRSFIVRLDGGTLDDARVDPGSGGVLASGIGAPVGASIELLDPTTCRTLATLSAKGRGILFVVGRDGRLSAIDTFADDASTLRDDVPDDDLTRINICANRVVLGPQPSAGSVLPPPGTLLFVNATVDRDDYRLWSVAGDGTNLHEVAHLGNSVYQVAFTADGSRLAVAHARYSGQTYLSSDIEILNAISGQSIATLESAMYPVWSQSANALFFTAGEGLGGRMEIGTALPDGSSRRLIHTAVETSSDWYMAASPDGGQLAFGSGHFDAQLQLLDVGSGAVRPLANLPTNGRDPAFSPAGTQVAIAGLQDGQDWSGDGPLHDILVIDVASGDVRAAASEGSLFMGEPSWSPIGKEIAFSSSGVGSSSAAVVDDAGSDFRDVISYGSVAGSVSWVRWSPDGSWLAYVDGAKYDVGDLHLVYVDGTADRLLVTGVFSGWYAWLP